MATKDGLGLLAGVASFGLVATAASNKKLEKEAARAKLALEIADRRIADLLSQLENKQAECSAAYADRNRWRESFEATTRDAKGLQAALDREARQRIESEAQMDQERSLREVAERRARTEAARAERATAQLSELEQQNAELARELANIREAPSAGD